MGGCRCCGCRTGGRRGGLVEWLYARTVDVHVQQIRAKLGDSSYLIETVRGVGYRMRG